MAEFKPDRDRIIVNAGSETLFQVLTSEMVGSLLRSLPFTPTVMDLILF